MRNFIYVPDKINDKSWQIVMENWFTNSEGDWDYKVIYPDENAETFTSFLDCLDECTRLNKDTLK